MKKKILLLLNLLLCILFFLFIKETVLDVHPAGKFRTKLTAEDVDQKARQLLNFLGISPEGNLKVSAVFPAGRIPSADSAGALDKYYWKATSVLQEGNLQAVSVSSESGNTRTELESHVLEIRFNAGGELIYFLPGTLGEADKQANRGRLLHPTASNAARIFLNYLGYDTTSIVLVGQNIHTDSLNQDYQFRFSAKSLPASELVVDVSNGRIIRFQRKFTQIHEKPENTALETVAMAWGILVHLILLAGLLYFLVTLIRKEAISFRLAVPLGSVVLVAQGFNTVGELLPFAGNMWWIFVVGLLVSSVGLAIGAILLVAVAEGLGRQVWPSRLLTLDLLLRKRQFSAKVSYSVLQGYLLGLTGAFFYLLCLKWFHFNLEIPLKIETKYSVSQFWWVSLAGLFSTVLISAIFGEYFYRLFAISWLRQYTRQIFSLVIFGVVIGANIKLNMQPESDWAKMVMMLLTSLLFVIWFLRTDLLTVLTGAVVFKIVPEAAALAGSTIFPAQTAGNVAGVILAIGALTSAWVYLRQNTETESAYFRPSYLQKMEEKERLTRELDIARHVQQQFLPAHLPKIPGYQIAASCIPAWEVGGDYYDFFEISDGRWGMVVADVSNKGVSAAFFMSMLKGFLKASVKASVKPSEALANLNELFVREVEKKHFVTAIFGILDPAKGVFRFARAGHQELLHLRNASQKVERYLPEGMGIGLAAPQKFNEIIEEAEIKLNSGDLLVLYTDGYIECMNEKNEIWGETRFYRTLQQYGSATPGEILTKIESELKAWGKSSRFNDDRTIILLKRK